MLLRYGDKKLIGPSVCGPPKVGYFAVESTTLTWQKCRENFSNVFTEKTKGFYFCHPPNDGNRVAAFIAKTEEILDLADWSVFSETDNIKVIWIEPSSFWMPHLMRRQLFTILLRCGVNYDPDKNNYEEALWQKDCMGKTHALETKAAVTRFLYGFTDFSTKVSDEDYSYFGYANGWVRTFRKCSRLMICKMLIKPSCCPNVIGCGKLWG